MSVLEGYRLGELNCCLERAETGNTFESLGLEML
jgi:hypothetical protein